MNLYVPFHCYLLGVMRDALESLDSSYHGGPIELMSDSLHSTSSLTTGSSNSSSYSGKQRECGLCVTVQPANCFPKLSTCHHR